MMPYGAHVDGRSGQQPLVLKHTMQLHSVTSQLDQGSFFLTHSIGMYQWNPMTLYVDHLITKKTSKIEVAFILELLLNLAHCVFAGRCVG
jgi:hypothetical protein